MSNPAIEPQLEPPTDGLTESNENAIALKEVEGRTQGQLVFRRFLRHRAAVVAAVIFILIVLLAFSSVGLDFLGIKVHGWWRYDWVDPLPLENNGLPTWKFPFDFGDHPFGQDEIGHDMFAQVMRGTQQSLMIMVIVGIVSTIIGIVIGAVSGFFRGWADSLLMRFTDVIIIIPVIVLTAVLGKQFGAHGSFVLAIVLGLASWTGLARLLRGDVLSLREREFVDAAKVAGASAGRIMFVHILPNAVGVVVVNATLLMSGTILTEAAISFLGFGVQLPDVSLGKIIQEYEAAFQTRPWLFWWPGSLIILIALTVNFVGDGLRDAFDPRQRRGLNRSARREQQEAKAALAGIAAGQANFAGTGFGGPLGDDASQDQR